MTELDELSGKAVQIKGESYFIQLELNFESSPETQRHQKSLEQTQQSLK